MTPLHCQGGGGNCNSREVYVVDAICEGRCGDKKTEEDGAMRNWQRTLHSRMFPPLVGEGFTFGVELLSPRDPSLASTFCDAVALVRPYRPAYYILPMKAPYFTASGCSGLQTAVDCVRQIGGRVILTVTATMSADDNNNMAATYEGVRRILHDFVVKRGGDSLLLLRGDAMLQRQGDQASSQTKERHGDFQDSVELLQFVAREVKGLADAPVSLFSSGYSQGHPMDRIWDGDRQASLSFMEELSNGINERGVDNTGHLSTRTWDAACVNVRKLIHRVEQVLSLRDVPSDLPHDARQRAVQTLVLEKILRHGVRGIITQMLTSAEEFNAYVNDVRRELRHADAGELVDEVVVLPTIMAPLAAEEYTRLLLFTKTIPSAAVQQALRAYRDGLKAAVASATRLGTSDEEKVCALMSTKTALEETFRRRLEDETLAMCRTLFLSGHRHLNCSAFKSTYLPLLLRLLDRLQEEANGHCGASPVRGSCPSFL
ncbi:hypothetical protein TcCL_ESM04139 [Trypanosoma cruzi]|uniref:Methylenetetrahydrofolate reductase (NAD(P)H) n=2 Tax=Trypanosoma cruzi TaxID=5693 RepID=Q4DKP0_TRYCC|nr:hypothetical protein, conserved [Trypanosoma cruzi]EAN93085.1 hypothetical protein, conserved [Trypanosoma cruzi]RNC58255.1 hypothetical protein TcCL_ESM04139 [Trypanosoma cruzi]|eukprot:XP_814936.1 hypothetical protein [Trypanosoma cruzi strain CL Brener]